MIFHFSLIKTIRKIFYALIFFNEIQFKVTVSDLISCYIITYNTSLGVKIPKSKLSSKLQEYKL